MSENIAISIQANDTLFFRTAKPFNMGEESWAENIFPNISPATIRGMLVSAYAAQTVTDATFDFEKYLNSFAIKMIALKFPRAVSFPMPADLWVEKNTDLNETPQIEQLTLSTFDAINGLANNDANKVYSMFPLAQIVYYGGDIERDESDNFYLPNFELKVYLEGKKPADYFKLSNHVIAEPKIGIGRDAITNTVKEGSLYRIALQRLQDLSIYVEYQQTNESPLNDKFVARLGGEAKTVSCTKITKQTLTVASFTEETSKKGIFKIYVATPCIFEQGILPDFINPDTKQGIIIPSDNNGGDIKVELLAAVVNKYQPIGGFCMQSNKPKPLYKAVPAGSVYYFKLVDVVDKCEALNRIQTYFHTQQNSLSPAYSQQGFGYCYIGKFI